MNKNRINTISFREIKQSFKRFLSLLIISMLGVLVFVGIKTAAPDMLASLDKYYDINNVYDIKIISTLGLTKNDVEKIKEIDSIKDVYYSYSKDILTKINKEDSVIKIIGITKDINKINLIKGKMPKNNSEILVEESLLENENIKIGDKIKIDDVAFKCKNLTIVGTVKSPLYVEKNTSKSRGSTNLGMGKINYYAYVNEDNFNTSYYTEIYVKVKESDKYQTNSKEYNKLINNALKDINNIKEERQNNRYIEIYNSINDEIIKEENNGMTLLNSAKKSLDDAKSKLSNGKKELVVAKNKLDQGNKTLLETKEKLDTSRSTLDNTKKSLDDANLEIKKAENEINEKLKNYGITLDDILNVKSQIDNISKEDIINEIPENILYYEEIVNIINNIDTKLLKDQIKDLINNTIIIDEIINNIPTNITNYDEIINVLNFYKNNKESVLEFIDALEKIEDAKNKYNEALLLYSDGEKKYLEGYNTYVNYYNEYQNGLSTYNNSLKIYNSNLNLYNSKVEEYYKSKNLFETQINNAKEKLLKIPESTWYINDRLDDSGYSNFIEDGKSVSNLSKVFPTIFFIVAILISLISMSRMVEDDRGLIGTLKSLGFSNKHIRKKYLIYSLIATILGGLIGGLIGFFILPLYIFNIYKILFDVPVFSYDFNPTSVIVGTLISIICICGATLLTIRKVVKEKPSELMRPKAPSNGKRVILEKIPFIWNKINFSNKVTIRNLFRYKKRVIMTIVGIIGCTALMLSGFAIRDSIVKIPDKQYKGIFTFDLMVYIKDDANIDNIFNNNNIKNKVYTNMDTNMTINGYSVNTFVSLDDKNLNQIVNLKDVNTGKELKLQDNKVIISDKLSRLINKKENDKITLKSSDGKTYTFTISSVCENYVGHYVFMNKNTYLNNIGNYKTNIVYLNIDNYKNENTLSKQLLKNSEVMSIISSTLTINSVDDMLSSLNSVILILIVLSGALSFVVLYNLSYINICERKREIATLKVLGFTDKEVDNYITKETIILTIIGIILGLVFGIFLSSVILKTVEIEMVRFIRDINVSSYIITGVVVLSFTLIVNKIIHYTLKKIDMIESLKSVE